MKKQIEFLKKQKQPAKFLLGYFLWKSGLCSLFHFKVNGIKFRFYKSGLTMNLFGNRDYIQEDLKYISKYLSTGNTFIDIGANIGTWTTAAAKVVGSEGKVLSFEPHPETFKYLSGNILANNFKNVEIYNVGCSDKEDQLFFSSNFDTMNHITNDSSDSIVIPVKDIDSYTGNLSVIDLIKIDVEGFELNVLKGASKTLSKTKIVILESNESFQKKYNYKTSDILILLKSMNFKVYKICETGAFLELDDNYSSISGEDLIAINSLIF